MALVDQLIAASYPAVLNAMRKPANQFAESAFLHELERQKMIKHVAMGPTLEFTLDYQRNPGAKFLANDLEAVSLAKVDVLTSVSYTPGELSVPIVWSRGDEIKNSSENQKVALVKSLIENGITSHDDLLEEALFAVSTNGFLGLPSLFPASGNGSPGGVDAAVDAWWRNYAATYLANGTDMNAQLTTAFNTASKGTGGMSVSLLVSGDEPQALYEAGLSENKRYIGTDEGDAGFKVLAFKTARWVFSQYGGDEIYGLNPKIVALYVAKEAFRELGEKAEIPAQNGYVRKIYSMLQFCTNNKSRGFVLSEA